LAIPEAMRRQDHLLPSILSADFSRLGQQVAEVMDAGSRIIHVDVMDGHFVPNISVGPLVVRALAQLVHGKGGYFSVHLMIEHPEDYIEAFVKAGADAVAVHVEACSDLPQVLRYIAGLGASPGVALNPASEVARIKEVLGLVDHILVMTVNPGFGGQELIGAALAKVPELRKLVPETVAIEVDGGVNRANVREVVRMGTNWVIAGSAVFGAAAPGEEVRRLADLMVDRGSV
jgi:ribulose-phosphate 3-epimerase